MSASDKEAADQMAADWARDHDELTARIRAAEDANARLNSQLAEQRLVTRQERDRADRIRAEVRATITAYATEGISADDALADIERAVS